MGDRDDRDVLPECKGLLNSWGDGLIKVEVLDGDRFNEEIFLGEVSAHLSE